MSKNYLIVIIVLLFSNSWYLLTALEISTLSGNVTNKADGEYVIGARVYITAVGDTKPIKGANTNKFGFFSIPKVPNGRYELHVSSIMFQQYKAEIAIDGDLVMNATLTPRDIKYDEVVVEANKDALPAVHRIGTFDVSPTFINSMPASIGGEIDVFRSLQLLPGVQTASELSSGLYVRGGSPDQNLTLLDGVIVYNPSHLGGFFSVFNSDALKDIRLIKGVFPAEYGGRLSSVLDMTMKEGNKEKITGDAMISLISSKLTLEGPITEDCSFMISGRRMYFDLIMLAISPEDFDITYYFYDLNAKINYKISDNDHIFLSGFFARDVLNSPEDIDVSVYWGNKTGNLRWMHIFNPTVFSNFSLIYTDYNFNTDISTDTATGGKFSSTSKIKDITLRGEFQIFPHEHHVIKTGIDITNHSFDVAANVFDDNFDIELEEEIGLGKRNIGAIEAALFVQDEWQVNEVFNTNLGARLFYFNKGNHFSLEPRLSASYKLNNEMSLKGGLAFANQFLHLIVRNDITLPTDLWFPSTESVKPSKALQGMLGYEVYLFDREYYLTIEGYYKKMYNLYEYRDDVLFSFGIPLEEQFTSGSGEAYGVELFINKQIGKLSGWIGYTLSWATRTFSELNYGKTFPPRYDRRHDISIVLNYKFNDKWSVGASWVYGTGQAYTMPTGTFLFNDNPYSNENNNTMWLGERYNYSSRNGTRLPAFHKLDLSVMYNSTFFGLPSTWSFNLYNAYNQKNPFAWYIINEHNYSTPQKKVKQLTLFPIIPSLGYSVHF